MKLPKSLEGTSIEPEERIDLDSPDAVERLDRIHDGIAARRPHDPDRMSEASEEVTAEDERELEEAHAENDMMMRQEMEELRSPESWLERERYAAARDLVSIADAGEFTPEEVAGIAKRFAARLASEHEALREAYRKEGKPTGKAASEQELYERLMHAYDVVRGPGKDGLPRETRRIEPLPGHGTDAPKDDDITSERAA